MALRYEGGGRERGMEWGGGRPGWLDLVGGGGVA